MEDEGNAYEGSCEPSAVGVSCCLSVSCVNECGVVAARF
jgi:hypothetical protein